MKITRSKLYEIIFEADTREGKLFDVILLWAILISVLAIMLESVKDIAKEYGTLLIYTEWFFTILFTIEYVIRIIAVRKPVRYIFSFFGIIDLLSILPTYLSIFLSGTHFFAIVRAVRLLRVFRVLKLGRYMDAANLLGRALKESRAKIIIFIGVVLSCATIIGTIMFLVEGAENGFTSIPRSIYWAIVTVTTVGFGDIAPQTPFGQLLAATLMIIGYGIIAVPTGIVTSEIVKQSTRQSPRSGKCSGCGLHGHEEDAVYCRNCETSLGN